MITNNLPLTKNLQAIYEVYLAGDSDPAIKMGAGLLHAEGQFSGNEQFYVQNTDFYIMAGERQYLDKRFCSLIFGKAIDDCFKHNEFKRAITLTKFALTFLKLEDKLLYCFNDLLVQMQRGDYSAAIDNLFNRKQSGEILEETAIRLGSTLIYTMEKDPKTIMRLQEFKDFYHDKDQRLKNFKLACLSSAEERLLEEGDYATARLSSVGSNADPGSLSSTLEQVFDNTPL